MSASIFTWAFPPCVNLRRTHHWIEDLPRYSRMTASSQDSLITSVKALFPNKVKFTSSGRSDVETSIEGPPFNALWCIFPRCRWLASAVGAAFYWVFSPFGTRELKAGEGRRMLRVCMAWVCPQALCRAQGRGQDWGPTGQTPLATYWFWDLGKSFKLYLNLHIYWLEMTIVFSLPRL